MDKKSHIYVKRVRSEHAAQKWQQKVSKHAGAKGWAVTAWGSVRGG